MPAGDAQRAWFPEMTDALQKIWTPEMSWEECASLCNAMTSMRAEIKAKKGIRGPLMRCKKCNQMREMTLLPIGIRSMLYALRKLEVLSYEEFLLKDKDWKRHQRRHKLDGYGNPKPHQSLPALDSPQIPRLSPCGDHLTSDGGRS